MKNSNIASPPLWRRMWSAIRRACRLTRRERLLRSVPSERRRRTKSANIVAGLPIRYSLVAEFGSAVQAVSCAVALQQELSSRSRDAELQVRIGIHLGDVVDRAGDLFGTAVNVAARLEGIAQPGGIVVSAAVRDAIAGKLAAYFTDLGLKSLKNIQEPLRAYMLSAGVGLTSPGMPPAGEALSSANRPSIAVLPFTNMSGNPEQQYFSDRITEDIITELSGISGRMKPRWAGAGITSGM
jgi:hypothetical protein